MSIEPASVVLSFEQKINEHDVDGLLRLFTPDGRFVDSLGNVIGMDKMQAAWTAYFRMVPDYRISHEEVFSIRDIVALFGKAEGTYTVDGKLNKDNFWTAPAGWMARVENGKIKEWRVYCDNEPIRAIMRKEKKS